MYSTRARSEGKEWTSETLVLNSLCAGISIHILPDVHPMLPIRSDEVLDLAAESTDDPLGSRGERRGRVDEQVGRGQSDNRRPPANGNGSEACLQCISLHP